ncbi:unnamed protein product [Symbiodinium natans]|uniref:Uncharacterized protein n=1 Tax=Symbiodinium natans TaxID=878477 RepID=A0A812R4L8_9DINO|nr:unnamed protein product [Symbiodinium natans]
MWFCCRLPQMCQADCCNEFATNPQVQLLYIIAAITYIVSAFLAGVLLVVVDVNTLRFAEPNIFLLAWIVEIIGLAVIVAWITMVSSRCCAPCCCKEQMPDVQACPLGECNANNLTLLDFPFHVAMIGILASRFLIEVLKTLGTDVDEDVEWSVLLWVVLAQVHENIANNSVCRARTYIRQPAM